MEFRVLGPVEVRVAERRLELGGPKRRTLLAVLLMHANRVVPLDRLVDAIWGEAPPATVKVQVQGHISALRQLFADAGATGEIITTRSPGYLIRVEPGQLDLDQFDRRATDARRALADARLEEAVAGFRVALELWRGTAFSGATGSAVQAEAARLEERKLSVIEERVDADLAMARHTDLISELTALTSEHPLRERLRAQLMLALYRAGRQADALEVYRDTRAVLVEELGLDPGPELRRLEQAILAGDASLELASAAPAEATMPPRAEASTTTPAQLPSDVADFTGRAKGVAHIRDLLGSSESDHPQAVVISAVAGKAGVGKTTLAVHTAHRLRSSFPDGQLHVDLRGVEPRPVDPAEALDRFLHALGVEGSAIPDGLEQRAAMYRSRMAGRRILVLLDNAFGEAQVRPLLPGTASCAVLITSRTRLAGLEGANLVDLDVLDLEEAVELLARVAGRQRVAAEPESAEQVVRLCGELPLAVRIAGARLAARPHWRLAQLETVLIDERRRLDELQIGDLEVRTSLSSSYDGLDPTTRRAFRRLGLLEVPDVAAWVIAALLDVPISQAERVVENLVDAQLLDVSTRDATGHNRYHFHDLLRVYARERVQADDTSAEATSAVRRALGGWLALAERATQSLQNDAFWINHGDARRWHLDRAEAGALLADPSAWFEAERLSLVAAIDQASTADLDDLAWDLANSLAFFLEVRGHFTDWRHTHEVALAATRRGGNHRGTGVMLRGLSEVHTYQDRYEAALQCLDQAKAAFRHEGNHAGEADVWCGFGLVYRLQGRPREALESFQHAVTMLREVGDHPDRAYALLGVAVGHLELRQPDDAAPYLHQALDSFRTTGYRRGEAQALHRLGTLHFARGHFTQAVSCLQQCLTIFADLGERHTNAHALLALGETYTAQSQPPQAKKLLERCLETFRDLGDRFGQARALHSLGELHRATGHPDQAATCLTHSLHIWRDLQLTWRQATTLRCLGDARAEAGNPEAAGICWRDALGLFQELGATEATDIALRLGHQVGQLQTRRHQSRSTRQARQVGVAAVVGDHVIRPAEQVPTPDKSKDPPWRESPLVRAEAGGFEPPRDPRPQPH